MLSDRYERTPCAKITVDREKRQRRELELDAGLKDSIRQYGVINPIIITHDFRLIAGERRLATSIELGLPDIPTRFAEDLPDSELFLLELEENVKRTDLSWQDRVAAAAKFHAIRLAQDADLPTNKIAEELGIVKGQLSEMLRVAEQFDNPRIVNQPTLHGAYNVILRQEQRNNAEGMASILHAGRQLFGDLNKTEGQDNAPQEPPSAEPQQSILNVSFLDWAPAYTGEPFNFLHCDFPFGIGLGSSGAWSGKLSAKLYDDSAGTYWQLLTCLCANLDKVMSYAGHMMFWFSMEHYSSTLRFFSENAPSLSINPFPLIWHKSDNVGIVPDPKHEPRRVYETAFIATRADKYIVKPVSNTYPAPTDRLYHPSTKPEPMLRHFFQLFVDDTVRLLDPTCGSGSALRAAESMGAQCVLGLESDKEHFDNAQIALNKFRSLRRF